MQIIAPGQSMFPPRLTFDQLYRVPPSNPIRARRLMIVQPTSIRGTPVYPGTVLAFDTALPDFHEDYGALIGSLKAEKVDVTTPLHLAPAPVEPPPLPLAQPAPEKSTGIMELARAIVQAVREIPKASKA